MKADDGLAVEGGLKETEVQMRHKNNENKDTDKVQKTVKLIYIWCKEILHSTTATTYTKP